MHAFRWGWLVAAASVVAAAGASANLAIVREQSRADRPHRLLPSARAARFFTFGHRLTASDYYYLQALQYVGTPDPERGGWGELEPLLDLVTELDPRHGYAYEVGAHALSGLAGDVAASNRLLEKGMRNLPARWTLPFYYAFNQFFYLEDFAKGAEYAQRAARLSGRWSLAMLAGNLAVAGEDYEPAIAFLREMIDTMREPETRAQLEERLRKVLTYRDLDRLEKAIDEYARRWGRAPDRLDDLVIAGILPALPVEPNGGRYEYLAGEKVRSSILGVRQPLRITFRSLFPAGAAGRHP